MKMMLPQITCAICNKIVDEIELIDRCDSYNKEVRVWCHGEMDTCVIPDYLVREVGVHGQHQFMVGTAFNNKKLPTEMKQLIKE